MRNAKSNKQGSEEKLVIDVYDGASLLDPATDFFLVEDLVEFPRKTFTTSKRGRPVEQVCTFTLHGLHCKKRPAIPTGLVPAVADRLREAGIDVSIRDHRKFGPAHKTSRRVWADSNGDDRRLLQAVKRHPLGQIEMSGTAAMIKQIHLIRRYFPKARILIVVATGDSARYLRRELGKLAEDGVKLKTGLWPRRPPRCLITTYPPLATCKTEQWDIVCFHTPNTRHKPGFPGRWEYFSVVRTAATASSGLASRWDGDRVSGWQRFPDR
jgi:hypothetical protein